MSKQIFERTNLQWTRVNGVLDKYDQRYEKLQMSRVRQTTNSLRIAYLFRISLILVSKTVCKKDKTKQTESIRKLHTHKYFETS